MRCVLFALRTNLHMARVADQPLMQPDELPQLRTVEGAIGREALRQHAVHEARRQGRAQVHVLHNHQASVSDGHGHALLTRRSLSLMIPV